MTTDAPTEPPRLSDADLAQVMKLIKGADSVELKVTVPVAQQGATIQGLPIDPVEAQPRQVFFFDTPDLDLNRAGVVVRARRVQGGRGDTVVKLRPVVPEALPADLRRSAAFNVEVDVLPGGYVCSASYKGRATGQEVRDAVRGGIPLRKLYSKEQRAFYREHAPEGIDLDSLVPLGPTFILKTKFIADSDPKSMLGPPDRRGDVALPGRVAHPGALDAVPPGDAFQVSAEARAYLAGRGVMIAGEQQTKTKAALEFYMAQLHAGDAATEVPPRGPDASPPAGEGRRSGAEVASRCGRGFRPDRMMRCARAARGPSVHAAWRSSQPPSQRCGNDPDHQRDHQGDIRAQTHNPPGDGLRRDRPIGGMRRGRCLRPHRQELAARRHHGQGPRVPGRGAARGPGEVHDHVQRGQDVQLHG